MRVRLVIALLVCANTAYAQKFTRGSAASPTAKLSARTSRSDTTAAPALGAKQLLDLRELLGPIEDQKLAMLEDLYAKTPANEVAERADYLYRMATIHARKQRFHAMRAAEADIAKRSADKADHERRARSALLAAVKRYQQLVDDPAFASAANIDTALFYYGYTLAAGGYAKEARAAYDKLLKNYPSSRFVPEAHLAFADYDFEHARWSEAAVRYRQVLKFPSSSLYRYAQYKLGWIDVRQGRFTDALQAFFDVVSATRNDPAHDALHRAARADLVRAFAEIGRADRALALFRRAVGDTSASFAMLELLADTYSDQGKHAHAIHAYRELLTAQPMSAKVCVWQHAVARALLASSSGEPAVREIEQLVKMYRTIGAKLPRAEASECRDAAAELSGQVARAFHQELVKTHDRSRIGYTRRLYAAYLSAFENAADYDDTLYYAAELEWVTAEREANVKLAAARWEEVARSFEKVVARGKLPGKQIEASAEAAMLAWMKALHIDPTVVPRPEVGQIKPEANSDEGAYTEIPRPRPLPDRELRMIAAFDFYLKHTRGPDPDGERVDVMFHKARLLQRYAHLVEAVAIFERIALDHPGHTAAAWAAQRALDGYNRLQRYAEMFAFADRLPRSLLERERILASTIAQLRRQDRRKRAEQLEREGNLIACGDAYLDLYNADPLADDAAVVIYNAADCFERGRSLSAAIIAFRTLQQYFPKHELAARSVARLGNVYASIAHYREAAEVFERYATLYGGEPNAPALLSDAVQFRKGLGDDAKAIDNTRKFIAMYGAMRPEAAAEAHFSIASIYSKQPDLHRLAQHLREYLDRYAARGGDDRRIAANAMLGDALWRAACPIETVDHTCMKRMRGESIGSRPIAQRQLARGARCGEEHVAEIAVVARDAAKVRTAMAAFDAAIEAFERAGRPRTALHYYAQARFAKVERDFERYLADQLPSLDFDPAKPAIAKASNARFAAWFERKAAAGAALRTAYEAIVTLGDGAVAIAAAARGGSVLQNFSAQLFRAEIPRQVRNGPGGAEASEAYCDALAERADPLAVAAEELYGACVKTSTRLGWFSEWSRMCERELGQLRPKQYPQAFERWRSADAVAPIYDLERPIVFAE